MMQSVLQATFSSLLSRTAMKVEKQPSMFRQQKQMKVRRQPATQAQLSWNTPTLLTKQF